MSFFLRKPTGNVAVDTNHIIGLPMLKGMKMLDEMYKVRFYVFLVNISIYNFFNFCLTLIH